MTEEVQRLVDERWADYWVETAPESLRQLLRR
jgi:hypothetical protein